MDADLPFDPDLPEEPCDWELSDVPVDLDVPPPPGEPEPWRGRGPGWSGGETPGLTWAIVGAVAVLGLLKAGFFLGSSMAVTLVSAVVFVAAHGLFIMAGASWFWPHRYN